MREGKRERLVKVQAADGTPFDSMRPVKGYTVHPGEKVEGVLAIRLNADGTMTVQKMPGATSASAFTGFTSDALTYVR